MPGTNHPLACLGAAGHQIPGPASPATPAQPECVTSSDRYDAFCTQRQEAVLRAVSVECLHCMQH